MFGDNINGVQFYFLYLVSPFDLFTFIIIYILYIQFLHVKFCVDALSCSTEGYTISVSLIKNIKRLVYVASS